jgi:hypothetical protein
MPTYPQITFNVVLAIIQRTCCVGRILGFRHLAILDNTDGLGGHSNGRQLIAGLNGLHSMTSKSTIWLIFARFSGAFLSTALISSV